MLENKQKRNWKQAFGVCHQRLLFQCSKVNCISRTIEVTQEDFLCWGFAFEALDYICIVTCEREKLKSPQLVVDLLSHLELVVLLKSVCYKTFQLLKSTQQLLMQYMSLYKNYISNCNVAQTLFYRFNIWYRVLSNVVTLRYIWCLVINTRIWLLNTCNSCDIPFIST